jgi:hypothetical protein
LAAAPFRATAAFALFIGYFLKVSGVTVSVRLTCCQSDYFFFLDFFFFATFLAFFFAMINSSNVRSGRGDSGHPPKRDEYERLAFGNATAP